MKIKRFVAKDMRSALTQIKEELGPEAVIMSNKKIAEGVELMAAVDYNMATPEAKIAPEKNSVPENETSVNREMTNDVVNISQQQAVQPEQVQPLHSQQVHSQPSNKIESATPIDSLSALLNRQVQQSSSRGQQAEQSIKTSQDEALSLQEKSIEQQFKRFTERLEHSDAAEMPSATNTPTEHINLEARITPTFDTATAPQQPKSQTVVNIADFEHMQKEMASIRQLLEHQVSGLMWQDMAQKDPKRAVLVNRLMALGLTEQIADQIAGYVPNQMNEDNAWQQALHLLGQQINTTNNDIIQRGGVVALVGPTGVGKTTTIAKLAARFAQLHGADQVALISTDTFRIAGFEQLATYGRIIGCQVKLAKDAQTLDALLQQYAKKKLILIDTAGMGQRDKRLVEHLTTLISNARLNIRNYLVIAANTQQRVMQENVERFKKVPLSGTIYTKLDESVSIGEIISTSIQNGLPIGYLTDGQQVPEDIKVANAEKLVKLADAMTKKLNFQQAAVVPAMPIVHTEVM